MDAGIATDTNVAWLVDRVLSATLREILGGVW